MYVYSLNYQIVKFLLSQYTLNPKYTPSGAGYLVRTARLHRMELLSYLILLSSHVATLPTACMQPYDNSVESNLGHLQMYPICSQWPLIKHGYPAQLIQKIQ